MLDALLIADLADGANNGGQGLRFPRSQHFDEARQGFAAADLGERIHGAFAHPPIGVLGGVDQLRHGAFVLGLIENFYGGAPNVLILVPDEGEHGVDDLRTADLAERVGGPRAHPPIAVRDHFQ